MLFRKHGFPEESELVVCTVTNIQYNSVFAKLDEYDMQGMIHISEISPGRIRNIRDYVKEGKVIVCVVLRINRERGHIDLSLRRVNDGQRRKKLEQMKLEQKAEKIIEFVAKGEKTDTTQLYNKVMAAIADEYESLADYFEDIVAGNTNIEKTALPKKTQDLLDEIVRQRIKLPAVEIKGTISLSVFEHDGVDRIKDILKGILEIDNEKIKITYLGAGKYDFCITAQDYKTAEDILAKSKKVLETKLNKIKSEHEFKRID
jgi:translation initiation factor 2 subunit 1